MQDRNYEIDPNRLAALAEHNIMYTEPEREYDEIVDLAALICDVPIATIAFIDAERTWFKAKKGIDFLQIPNDVAFCAYARRIPEEIMAIRDLWWDPRFSMNPLVVGAPYLRSFASVPIVTKEMHMIGSLSVADLVPRDLTPDQLNSLVALSNQLNQALGLRRKSLQLTKLNEELKNLSITDDLTGLFNRRGIRVHAEQQLRNYKARDEGRGMWVMVADIDGLKLINDAHGHVEGSRAIKQAGELLASCIRGSDLLGRPGGDEFIGVLVNTHDEVALRLPDRIEAAFKMHNLSSDRSYELAISVGLVKVLRDEDKDIISIVRRADEAMYREKRRKKGRTAIGNVSGEIHLSHDPIHIS